MMANTARLLSARASACRAPSRFVGDELAHLGDGGGSMHVLQLTRIVLQRLSCRVLKIL